MSSEVVYTCQYMLKKLKPRHDSEFRRLLRAPLVKKGKIERRKDAYYRRNFILSFGIKLRPSHFCYNCKTNQCHTPGHKIVEMNPIVRIPRQTASKTRWKQFFIELHKFNNKKLYEDEM